MINVSAFNEYDVQLALALDLYIEDKDNDGTILADEAIADILTDLK